jgi:hypothetical protein
VRAAPAAATRAGLVFCSAKPGTTGELLSVRVRPTMRAGPRSPTTSVWVVGDGDWWFDPSSADRIDLVPEKRRYEPGETARFQVRMPFRTATVLVTVEREGVLSHASWCWTPKSPVIEVPDVGSLRPERLRLGARGARAHPAGRASEDAEPTGSVDLAKPAYKLGMAEVKVGRREYELNVKGDASAVDLQGAREGDRGHRRADPAGNPAANAEIALAAVDEGLLELSDNTSWNILEALLGQRPIEVFTATAQGQVIGKRHYGRKPSPPAAAGARRARASSSTRCSSGAAREARRQRARASRDPVERLAHVVSHRRGRNAGAARFGHGQATIRTTQDLMLFSGLPPVVRDGDEFSAMFTLRNTTSAPIEAKLAWAIHDRPAADKARARLAGGEVPVALKAGRVARGDVAGAACPRGRSGCTGTSRPREPGARAIRCAWPRT